MTGSTGCRRALVHVLQRLADGGELRLLVALPHALDDAGHDRQEIDAVPLLRRRLEQVSVDEAVARHPAGDPDDAVPGPRPAGPGHVEAVEPAHHGVPGLARAQVAQDLDDRFCPGQDPPVDHRITCRRNLPDGGAIPAPQTGIARLLAVDRDSDTDSGNRTLPSRNPRPRPGFAK